MEIEREGFMKKECGLCFRCRKALADKGVEDIDTIIARSPYFHCHHNDCWCEKHPNITAIYFGEERVTLNFCPECGKKINIVGER